LNQLSASTASITDGSGANETLEAPPSLATRSSLFRLGLLTQSLIDVCAS
jgi:hypothetical protein